MTRATASAVGRRLTALGILGLVVAGLTRWSIPYRSAEALVAATLQSPFTPTRLFRDSWHLSHRGAGAWFVVTTWCTSSVLLVPLALVGAWATLVPLVRVRATLTGCVVGGALVVGLNSVRLAAIGLAWARWGRPSLWLTHDVVGTLISLSAMAAGVAVQLAVIGRARGHRPRSFEERGL